MNARTSRAGVALLVAVGMLWVPVSTAVADGIWGVSFSATDALGTAPHNEVTMTGGAGGDPMEYSWSETYPLDHYTAVPGPDADQETEGVWTSRAWAYDNVYQSPWQYISLRTSEPRRSWIAYKVNVPVDSSMVTSIRVESLDARLKTRVWSTSAHDDNEGVGATKLGESSEGWGSFDPAPGNREVPSSDWITSVSGQTSFFIRINGTNNGGALNYVQFNASTVPEPATGILLLLGGVTALIRRRRK